MFGEAGWRETSDSVSDANGRLCSALKMKQMLGPRPFGLVRPLILGLGLFVVYSANARPIGAFDTMPAIYLPVAIIRCDGPFLDRFSTFLQDDGGYLPRYTTRSRGHIVSRYPIGPAVLAVPFALPQVLVLDWLDPGWEQGSPWRCLGMAKNSAAAIAALTGILLLLLLQKLEIRGMALVAASAASVASNMWCIASQGLWQHGLAALALIGSLLLLVSPAVSRTRLILSGLTTAGLVCFRSIDSIFALVIFAWVVRNHTKSAGWFLPLPILAGAGLIGYNYYFFETISGGQAQLEELHREVHAVAGPWSGNFFAGAAGTLLSPSHGLLVFTPWIAVTLAVVPAIATRLKSSSLICWLLWSIVPYFILLSKYSVWWGGHCFGPRYWTDLIPLFAILLGFGLEWSWNRCRSGFMVFAVSIAFSFAVQLVGAFCYPSSWETTPVDVDQHHERLWDLRDSELTRCLSEGIK